MAGLHPESGYGCVSARHFTGDCQHETDDAETGCSPGIVRVHSEQIRKSDGCLAVFYACRMPLYPVWMAPVEAAQYRAASRRDPHMNNRSKMRGRHVSVPHSFGICSDQSFFACSAARLAASSSAFFLASASAFFLASSSFFFFSSSSFFFISAM